ncbi:MAG: class I mannose-6-phosphate isomerase [Acidobacteria bacterium]|nr:class I mannose-6-phosphate isomerase [Acidobacteriota bacterium]
MNLFPARIGPKFVERIWGTRSLAPLFPEQINLPQPVGWLTGNDCVFETSAFAGQKLGVAWKNMPPEWAGTRMNKDGPFPLLVKFLFPTQWLSVQVHPNDDYARAHESAAGGVGKTEMWYALAAEKGAEVLVGLKSGVDAAKFRKAIEDSTVETCIQRLSVREGDAIFVPAGTVHTIGPGLLLCEIQENSDITYRVFDYNRVDSSGKPRALHIEQAVAVTNYGPQRGGRTNPILFDQPPHNTFHVACRHFATEKWEFANPVDCHSSPERFELLIVLAGRGKIEARGQSSDYSRAQVWLVPAALSAYRVVPDGETALLRTYVPDLDMVETKLRAAGISEDQISQVIFR